jgi:hypothetical protein
MEKVYIRKKEIIDSVDMKDFEGLCGHIYNYISSGMVVVVEVDGEENEFNDADKCLDYIRSKVPSTAPVPPPELSGEAWSKFENSLPRNYRDKDR